MGNKSSSSASASKRKLIPTIEYSSTAAYVCHIIELISDENVELTSKLQIQISLLQNEISALWNTLFAMASHENYPTPRVCPLVLAVGIKTMIQHIYLCENTKKCQKDQCGYYRELLKHSRDCVDNKCQLCCKIIHLKKVVEIQETLKTLHLEEDNVSISSGFHSNVQSTLGGSTAAKAAKWHSSNELAIFSEANYDW